MTVAEILAEDDCRCQSIAAPYDPVTGLGSVSTPRREVRIKGFPCGERLWLPLAFADTTLVKVLEHDGFDGTISMVTGSPATDGDRATVMEAFCRERIKYDVEFWFATCCTINDKATNRDAPFVLNRAQRMYLKTVEELRLSGKPIDIILVKARQWGGSTMTILYALWVMLVLKRNWNAVICGDIENQSRIVTGMLAKVMEHYPEWASEGGSVKALPYQGSQSTREINVSGSRYSIGSAQKPEKLRSENISIAHLTEVGVWRETKGRKPEDLVQSIFGSILDAPLTMKVLESTAKGQGNYLHHTWLDAVAGRNNFTPVFIPWFAIDLYSKPLTSSERMTLAASMSEHDKFLWSAGATLEAIAWYNGKAKEFFTEPWRMCSEFPTTADEAFQSSAMAVFRNDYIARARATCRPPLSWGHYVADGDKGREAMSNIVFSEISGFDPRRDVNCCQIWSWPDTARKVLSRYLVSVDTNFGTSDAADYSYMKVFDRLPMLDGGVPEVVCTWHGRAEPDRIPWIAVTLAEAYGHALLVIESNRMETSDNTDFIFDEIAGVYDNLYSRTTPEQIRQGAPVRYGFHTNSATKPTVITELNRALRDTLYIERDAATCDELGQFEYKDAQKKTTGAVDGCHDDRVMATAIGVYACYKTDLPVVVEGGVRKARRIVSEAVF